MKKSTVLDKMEKLEEKVSSGKSDDAGTPSSLKKVYLAFFSAHIYTIGMGLVACYPAPATVDMRRKGSRFINLTGDEETWIASWPVLTCGIGCLLSGYLSQKLGRKAVLIFSSTPYVISWLMIAYAPSMVWIYIGRIVSGLCMGICCVATSAYVTEISPISIRGMLGSGFELFFAIGSFITLAEAYILRWSWLAISSAAMVTAGSCFMYFMPESPEWLHRKKRQKEAVHSMRFLKGKNMDVDKELASLAKNDSSQEPKRGFHWRQFLEPTVYKPLLISMSLFFFQHSCGINIFNSYVVTIFQNSGSSIDPQSSSVLFAAMRVLATPVGSVLLDRAGRRVLYITSGAVMTVTLTVFGLYMYLESSGYDLSKLSWIPLLCSLIYIAFYAAGFGPIPLTMTPEMVPISSRSAVLGVSVAFSGVVGFSFTKMFDITVTLVNYYGLFWICAGFSFAGVLFGMFCLPETKGRSIEEINKSFE